MTRRELVRWTLQSHENSALVIEAKQLAPVVWEETQLRELVHDQVYPTCGAQWAAPASEAAMELAAICAGFLTTPMAEHRGERLFFPSEFDRDMWLTQYQV